MTAKTNCSGQLKSMVMHSMANYLRAHKEEPYAGVSVANAM